jgi:uncharacterized membrane protein YdbT with pleckstrin-like domain
MSNDHAERLKNRGGDADEPEQDLWSGGYSGKAMYGSWLGAVVATIALPIVGLAAYGVLIGFGLAALIWIALAMLLGVRKLGVHYELSSQRFIHKVGILSRRTDRIELIDIDDVSYVQGIIQRVLGVGSIKISSSDRSHPELTMIGIDQVEKIADMIDDARRLERRRRGLHIEAI